MSETEASRALLWPLTASFLHSHQHSCLCQFLSTNFFFLQDCMDGSLKSVSLGSQVLSQIPAQIISTAHVQTLQQSREINQSFLDPETSKDSCTSFHTQNYVSGFGEWSLLKFCVCLLYLELSWSERTSYLMDNPPGSSGIKKWNIEKECSSHSMQQHQKSINSKGRLSAQHSVPPGPALLEQRPFRQARYRALPCFTGAGRNTPKAEFLGSSYP